MGKFLKNGMRRVSQSGLFWPLVLWTIICMACNYPLVRLIMSPWQHRTAISQAGLHPSYLRAVIDPAKENGALIFLIVLNALRLMVTPAIELKVYQGLVGSTRKMKQVGLASSFYRLAALVYMTVALGAWLFYVTVVQSSWVYQQPGLFLLLILGLGLLWFFISLGLGFYRVGLVSSYSRATLRAWLRTTWAHLLISVPFLIISVFLHNFAANATGFLLIILLAVSNLLMLYVRLWKLGCLAEASLD